MLKSCRGSGRPCDEAWKILLILTGLGYLCTLTQRLLLAMLCFALAVVVIVTHTTTAGPMSQERVYATTVALCNQGLSFLSTCLVGLFLLARAPRFKTTGDGVYPRAAVD